MSSATSSSSSAGSLMRTPRAIERIIGARRFATLIELAPNLVVPHTITADPDKAIEFFDTALRHGHEGIMAKSTAAPYVAGARGQSWLKVKKPRTLDLVILAAEWGNGRRRGWLSNLHLGARDTDKGGFAMLGKTFKGMTDEMLRWQTEALLLRRLDMGTADDRGAMVVRVRPELVAEVAFSDVQRSARYPGGVTLRFARLKRYRSDKRADEADTIAQVRALLTAP